MHFSSVITLCLVSLILSSKPLGSWEPDTFARNDIHLDPLEDYRKQNI